MIETTIIDDYKILEYKKTNVYVIENIIDDKFCNDVIKIIETVPLKKSFYAAGNNVQCYYSSIDQLLKKNDELYYSFSNDPSEYNRLLNIAKSNNSVSTNALNGIKLLEINYIKDNINTVISKIDDLMKCINNRICFEYNTGYILRKIYGPTRLHSDGISKILDDCELVFIRDNRKGHQKMVRSCTLIFCLNDNYDGGIINFPYYDISIKLKKGSVILFPPFWTHQHEVSELLNNTFRYTITTWSCEKVYTDL